MPKNYHYGMPFRMAVRPNDIKSALDEYGIRYRNRDYTPETIIWSWMSQIVSGDKSCRSAVSELVARYAAEGKTLSPNTSGFIQARQRLDVRVIQKLSRDLARELEDECKEHLTCPHILYHSLC